MSLVINHNMMAMNAARSLSQTYNRLSVSVARLASGLRINSAADDAAGLAIREIMRTDIRVLNQECAMPTMPFPSSRLRMGPCRLSTRN